jgi:peptidoglycan L-alanyl-D-glutamate endopeptidase CwlK
LPADNFRRVDLDLIEPEFRERVLHVIAECLKRGFSYHATRGYDTYGAQMALWAKGRTVPGPKVTNAKGGQSAHNFGIAIDFVLDKKQQIPGLQPDWTPEAFRVLVEEVERAGLHSGKGYKDLPHVSLPGYVTAVDLLPLHLAWEKSADEAFGTLDRLKRVWQRLERKG